ncbi:Panacea domain-containing protein [Shouchella clausii]|uniref:Panacea domain-containing protein n=1 Tax=Shouchella clausii TaxID=79880 RepID=UPI001C735D49|nr:hypothetical protein [Shouchella clausii]MBX0320104.1 hypothetical protein [Shouchella clausii]
MKKKNPEILDLAYHIFGVAKEADKPITNLQLQRIMFFAFGFHIRVVGRLDYTACTLYDNPFHRWEYGPVSPEAFYRYTRFRSSPITTCFTIKDPKLNHLNPLITSLLDIDGFELARLSRRLPSWSDWGEEIITDKYVEPYSLWDILRDFSEDSKIMRLLDDIGKRENIETKKLLDGSNMSEWLKLTPKDSIEVDIGSYLRRLEETEEIRPEISQNIQDMTKNLLNEMYEQGKLDGSKENCK